MFKAHPWKTPTTVLLIIILFGPIVITFYMALNNTYLDDIRDALDESVVLNRILSKHLTIYINRTSILVQSSVALLVRWQI